MVFVSLWSVRMPQCYQYRLVIRRCELGWAIVSYVSVLFQLGDLLIKPIQRIQKYHLLVKKILAYSQSAREPEEVITALEDAVMCTSIIPKNANDMMDVGRLQGFTVSYIHNIIQGDISKSEKVC